MRSSMYKLFILSLQFLAAAMVFCLAAGMLLGVYASYLSTAEWRALQHAKANSVTVIESAKAEYTAEQISESGYAKEEK